MICERAIDHIMQAVEEEKKAAIGARGLFHSDHEAWAVLREEVEELCECLDNENAYYLKIDELWDKVRRDKKIGNDDVKDIGYWAKSCAEEAVQVMAMIQKWGEGIVDSEE